MDNVALEVRGLTPAQIEQFITDGFIRIDRAFPRALASWDRPGYTQSPSRAVPLLRCRGARCADTDPCRVTCGHRQLAPAGEEGLTLRELAADGFAASAHHPIVTATGDAGTVYLCHPFLVHAAQPHEGERPRFLAQPPLFPVDPHNRPSGNLNPVEQATDRALG